MTTITSGKTAKRLSDSLDAQALLGLLGQMMLIRRFEERCAQSYQQAKIGGFCHLYIGQEAVAVGSIGALRGDDPIITAYRDHGHALARGMAPKYAMAELFGKVTGCSKGKGGSMHFFDKTRHMYGGHAIVGGQCPLGVGLAFAIQYNQEDKVCVCYLGDGALNQGGVPRINEPGGGDESADYLCGRKQRLLDGHGKSLGARPRRMTYQSKQQRMACGLLSAMGWTSFPPTIALKDWPIASVRDRAARRSWIARRIGTRAIPCPTRRSTAPRKRWWNSNSVTRSTAW